MSIEMIDSEKQLDPAVMMETGWTHVYQPGGAIAYESADAPTYVMQLDGNYTGVLQVGDRIFVENNWFIVTGITQTTGPVRTHVYMYGGQYYALTGSSLDEFWFSHVFNPVGFATAPDIWTQTVSNTSNNTQASPSANTWYNLGSVYIDLPIGRWRVSYKALPRLVFNSSTSFDIYVTLSTTNNGDTNPDWRWTMALSAASANHVYLQTAQRGSRIIVANSKTRWYLNLLTTGAAGSLQNRGDVSSIEINAESVWV